jgi:hypothetical protein
MSRNRLGHDCFRGWCAKAASTLALVVVIMCFAVQSTNSKAAHDGNGAHRIAAPCEYHLRPEAELFLKENDAAMQRMMTDMMFPPSGNIDRDFANMMIAHHQGAIDMAKAYLRSGKNAALLRMAQEIIITQQQEIVVMRRAIVAEHPPATSTPDHCAPH